MPSCASWPLLLKWLRPWTVHALYVSKCQWLVLYLGCNARNVRHESSGQSLEEERDGGVQAGQVRAETRAQCEQAREQSDDGEEKRNQVEGEHESAQVVVVASTDERLGNTLGGAKVARWVKRQRCLRVAAVGVVAILHTAKGEEGPSCWVPRGSIDVVRGRLEEVHVVERARIGGAGENDEELEQDASSKDDQGGNGEDRAWEEC